MLLYPTLGSCPTFYQGLDMTPIGADNTSLVYTYASYLQ